MKIETKRNIGDTVWFMYNGRIKNDEIYAIHISICRDDVSEEVYEMNSDVAEDESKTESQVFSTKEELIASL